MAKRTKTHRNNTVTVSYTDAELEQVEAAAAAQGMPRAIFIRVASLRAPVPRNNHKGDGIISVRRQPDGTDKIMVRQGDEDLPVATVELEDAEAQDTLPRLYTDEERQELRDGKWPDAEPATPARPVVESRFTDPDEQDREYIRRWLRTGIWVKKNCPSPLSPECNVKADVMKEFAADIAAFLARGGPAPIDRTPPKIVDPLAPQPGERPLAKNELNYWTQRIDNLMQRGVKKTEHDSGWDVQADGPLPWQPGTRVPPQVLRLKQAEIAVARNDNVGVPAG